MEIGEAHRLIMKAVQVGRLEDGVAETGKIAVALVVAEDEDDVWLRGQRRGGEGDEKHSQCQQSH